MSNIIEIYIPKFELILPFFTRFILDKKPQNQNNFSPQDTNVENN